jgi:MraZ protein
VQRFRGGFPATIDAKGRVKLPARLREQLEEGFGHDVFVCSFFPHELRVYPLPVWELVEERLLSKPAMKPALLKLIERAFNYGQLLELDDHGRLMIPALLREMVAVEGGGGVRSHQPPGHHQAVASRVDLAGGVPER